MEIDANLMDPDIGKASEHTRIAEEMGFSAAWFTEMTHSPFSLAAEMASETDEIDIGSAIAVAFPRSPMVTAYSAWDAQELTGGEFILGLGTQVKGHIERRFSETWESPGPRLREYVLALQEIWSAWSENRSPNFEGDHYSITLCPPQFIPDPPEELQVPIYVAGVNSYNITLAGELCDGLHVHPFHSPEYVDVEVIPYVEKGARIADRDPEEVTLATSVMAVVGDSEEERKEAREAVREEISFYASTRTYRKILETHGWGDVCDQLHELSVNDEWDNMPALVTDEMVDAFSVEGSWDQMRERIEDRYEHMDRVALYRPFRGEEHWSALTKS